MVDAAWQGCRFAPRCNWAIDSCRTGRIDNVEHDGRVVRCANLAEVEHQSSALQGTLG
jgi:ABC-type dipeptide/oligopeptide/nickel transport system ATPase component